MIQHTNIYIDGGIPKETHDANAFLQEAQLPGLDGQTTNPTLIAKNLSSALQGTKATMEEAVQEYKRIVTTMRSYISGPISIQVLGNPEILSAEDILSQARDRVQWIPNAVIKFPCTTEGLKAVETFCQEGPVNITLVFSQQQAAAVYSATRLAKYPVYVSPFVGRLDDKGKNGMDIIANILTMYKNGDGHVDVLTASTRSLSHIHYALQLGSQVITIPYTLFMEWKTAGFSTPDETFTYTANELTSIPYEELDLGSQWTDFDIHHELTDVGLNRFWSDWSSVVS